MGNQFRKKSNQNIREQVKAASDSQVVALMQDAGPLGRARKVFSAACARIEQAQAQKNNPTIFELRRMEFAAVLSILDAVGIEIGDLP